MFKLLLSPAWAMAECKSFTASAQDDQAHNSHILIQQQRLANGKLELTVSEVHQAKVIRTAQLSFAGSTHTGCHFVAVSVLKGGDWGWHIAWVTKQTAGVFYARLDSEAWVTSLPKRLSHQAVSQVQFVQDKRGLSLHSMDAYGRTLHTLYSDDEGRNWQDAAQ